jgi:hypothetical protein
MSLARLTEPDAVILAAEEYDRIGREAFLARYGYRPASSYYLEHNGRLYDSKAIAGVAVGIQHGEPLRGSDFVGGEATVRRRLEKLGFRVQRTTEIRVTTPDATEVRTEPPDVSSERERRLGLWAEIKSSGAGRHDPARLNELRVFYGGRGIWVHQELTRGIGGSTAGVAVGLLHTGSAYADDLHDGWGALPLPCDERSWA